MEKNWMDKIEQGMKLIIEGCKENPDWCDCQFCLFDNFCTSVYRDDSHNFSTPDTWEEEGLNFTKKRD